MAIEFEVKLSDGVSAPAGSAAHQVDVLTKQMRGLQNSMVKSQALGDSKAFNKQADQFQKLSKRVTELGGTGGKGSAGGAIGKATKATESFGAEMKLAGMRLGAVVGVAVGTVAVLALVAAGAYKATKAIAELTETRRQLLATFDALGSGKTTGAQVVGMLEQLEKKVPYTAKEMSRWAIIMEDAGVRDLPTLERASKAAAAASAIFGDTTGATGDKVAHLVVQIAEAVRLKQGIGDLDGALRGTGVTVDDVAASMKITGKQLRQMTAEGRQLPAIGAHIQEAIIKKGKPALVNMALTWDALTKRMRTTAGHIFDGIAQTPGFQAFLRALFQFVSLFDQGETAGKAMGDGVTKGMGAAFGALAKLMTWTQIAILDVAIAGVKLYTALLPTIVAIKKAWASFKEGETARLILSGMEIVATKLGAALLVVGKILFAVTATAVALAVGLVGAIYAVVGKVAEVLAKPLKVLGEWVDAAKDAGKNFIAGLIAGITGGAVNLGKTVSAVTDVAVTAAKKSLKIQSPSKVMMGVGYQASAGLAMGVEQGTAQVEQAASGAGAAIPASSGDSAKGGSKGGGLTINVQPGAITITGGSGGIVQMTEEALAAMLEKISLQMGLAT